MDREATDRALLQARLREDPVAGAGPNQGCARASELICGDPS
jgi:hypothetical protein